MNKGSVMRKKVPGVELGELKQKLQELRSDILEDVDAKLQTGIDRIVSELGLEPRKHKNGIIEKPSGDKKSGRSEKQTTKEFVICNTPLVNLWKIPEVRSLYNGVLAFFIILYFHIGLLFSMNVERFQKNIAVVFWTFSQFHTVAATWSGMNLSIVFILYPLFRVWATNRALTKRKGLYDSMFCTLFILHEAALFIVPAIVVVAYNVPPISSFIILLEQSRLFMKSYAFVRENIPRALKYKPHQDGEKEDSHSSPCPDVEKLAYFLFAPTLVYSDNYPRSPQIRWSHVTWHCLQMIHCVLGYFIALIWFGVNTFSQAGVEPMTLVHFVTALAQSVFAGAIVMIIGFYATLHNIQETFGELLRFGDRRFYGDWWNCTSYAEFFRSWNTLVHDWLYSYVYRDVYVVLRNRTLATLAVFALSAVVHEYILAFCLKFLFPLLFTLFMTFGVLLVFITRKLTSKYWNIFLWYSMFQGYGLLLTFYSLEWYARVNCPRIMDSWLDYLVPRSFYCQLISWSS